MGLNDFTIKRPERALPIFILADTSGSMDGEKITMLNNALREMISTLAGIKDIRGSFKVCVITFGNEVKVHQPLTDVGEITLDELTAFGRTPMGEAIDLLVSLIEDKTIVPSTAYTPTIVLVSDGLPTDINVENATLDDYMTWEPIKRLHTDDCRASKCLRLAMGIGQDADKDMLKAFINNDNIPVFKSNEAAGIEPFFKWVTMSTISRMTGTNPNEISVFYPVDVDTDDLPI
jgi:uncharacterized protein YegL